MTVNRAHLHGDMSPTPTRLCLLGGVGLLRPGGPVRGRIARRHPLATLAVLATERAAPVTRDRLAALLWPESDERRARRRLRVTLHALRTGLGPDAVLSVGDALHLDGEALACDLWDFEDAAATAPERAVAHYGGAFLEGFHLGGSVEFERWATRRRERLRQRYLELLEGLADDARASSGPGAALEWLRLRAAADPYNEHATRRLVDALEQAGEREAALHQIDVFARRLRAELGVEPGSWLASRREALRRHRAGSAATPVDGAPAATERGAPSARGDSPGPDRASGSDAPREHGASQASTAPEPPRRRPVRPALLGGAAVLAVLVLGRLVSSRHGSAADTSDGFGGSVAVFPFAYSGGEELAYLSGGMADLLGRKVEGIAGLSAVDPNVLRDRLERAPGDRLRLGEAHAVAEQTGAEAFVVGSVLEAGGELTLEATLYGRDGEVLGRASAQGAESEIFGLVDRLTLDLLADRLTLTRSEVAGIAATTTRSVPALRAYLEGESLLRGQRLEEASDRFRRAIAEDSTFALAYYRLAVVESFRYRLGPAERAHVLDLAQRALAHSERLTWRDREVLRGFEAFRRFDLAAAEAHLGAVLDEHPDDVEALYQLGEALLHINRRRGRSPGEAGPLFARAVALQPDHVFALRHLVDVALLSHDPVATDTLVDRLEALSPETARPYRFVARWMIASEDDRERLLAGSTDLGALQRAAELLARPMRALADSRRVWRRVLELTEDPSGPGWYAGPGRGSPRGRAYDFLAHLDGAAGLWSRASAHLDSAEIADGPGTHLGGRLALAFWPFLDVPRERSAELLDEATELTGYDGRRVDTARVVADQAVERYVAFVVAHVAARAGDTARYEEALSALEEIGAIADSVFADEFVVYSPTSLERAARAYPAFLAGQWSEVVEILQAPGPRTLPEENRWMLARALDETGRDEEALTWYGSFDGEVDGPRGKLMPPFAPAHYYRGRIREERGEAESAASHYARFLEVWRDPDPALRPMVRDAHRRLAGLEGRL